MNCTANELTGFNMRATLALNGLIQAEKTLNVNTKKQHLDGAFGMFRMCFQKEQRHQNTLVSVGPRAKKFNVVSNDHVRTPKYNFSVFDWKFRFWTNLFKKNQNFRFKLIFVTYTNSNMQNSMVVFTFLFQTGNSLFEQIWSKQSNVSL